MDSLYGKPYGVNYAPSTPLREGFRSYFADRVVGAVHIGVDVPPIRCPVQATLHAPATERRRLCRAVDRQRARIEETGPAGVALPRDLHLDAHQDGLAGQHLNEPGVADA